MPDDPTYYDTFMGMDGPDLDIKVERERHDVGRSFSVEAMQALNAQMITWVGTRIMQRWNRTHEPPTALRVTVHVEVG